MSTTLYLVDKQPSSIEFYSDLSRAQAAAALLNVSPISNTEELTACDKISLKTITNYYNVIAPSIDKNPVVKFKDRPTAARRFFELVNDVAKVRNQTVLEKLQKSGIVFDFTGEKKKTRSGDERIQFPRTAKLRKTIKTNPRRPGTRAWHQWEKIKDGMTIKEYIEANGNMVDLIWEIKRDRVQMY